MMKFSRLNLRIVLAIASIHLGAEVPNTFEPGTPAKASEVNENFSALSSAIDAERSRHPERFYPDWRHEPTFYIELPELGGYWKGRLDDHHQSNFTNGYRNLTFVNIYQVEPAAHLFLAFSINPSHDFSAYVDSLIAHESEASCLIIPFGCSRHRYTFYSRLEKQGTAYGWDFTVDSALESSPYYTGLYRSWWRYLTSDAVVSLLNQIYALLEMGSDEVAKHCEDIELQLNADWTIDVSAEDCSEISYSQ